MYGFELEGMRRSGDFRLIPPRFQRYELFGGERRDWSVFNCSVFNHLPGEFSWRLYYTAGDSCISGSQGAFVCESADGITWNEARPLLFSGIPSTVKVCHLSVLQPDCGDRKWRLFGWVFLPAENLIRYLMFSGDDGLEWQVHDFDNPGLIHPMDREAGGKAGFERLIPHCSSLPDREVLSPEELFSRRFRLANDASTVNRLSGGGFEFFGVWLAENPIGGLHRAEMENVPSVYRIIQRRTSPDGINWSGPEIVLAPDDDDPPLFQFYNLTVTDLPELRIGLLDRYECERQTLEPELIFCRDPRRWHRPFRRPFLPVKGEGADAGMIHTAHNLVFEGNRVRLYYTVSHFHHNNSFLENPLPRQRSLRMVEFPADRYCGVDGSGRLDIPLIFFSAGRLTLNAEVRGEIRYELLDINGAPLPGCGISESIPLRGNQANHCLRWRSTGGPVMKECTLRLEMRDSTLYRINPLLKTKKHSNLER